MIYNNSLINIIPQFQHGKVLCLGDIMLDQFVYGTVDRISPEAPVPIFRITRRTEMLGGAGNVVRNIASLQGKVHFIGVVGNDAVGQEIESKLSAIPQTSYDLIKDAQRCSTHKIRYVSGSHQLLRADEENTIPLSLEKQQEVLKIYEEALDSTNVVVLSDYGKGFFTPQLTRQLINLARAKNVAVIIDPKGNDYSIYEGATIITPNLKELEAATALTLLSDETIVKAAEYLQQSHNIETVLVTRSRDGMTLVSLQESPVYIPAYAQEVYDVSGAGDTVIATFSLALAAQASVEAAARLANQAAGIVVKKVGTATVTPTELQEILELPNKMPSMHAVVLKEQALEQILTWHRQGLKIGFTNGCYDILHTGHISLLEQAKLRCDRLIVGLNSDASVKRLKGQSRPINEQSCRAEVLASLTMVDLVVIFDEDTPLELISYLKPDLLVKGADYALDKVVGAKEVMSWGGEVYLAELVPGKSTTNIIQKAA